MFYYLHYLKNGDLKFSQDKNDHKGLRLLSITLLISCCIKGNINDSSCSISCLMIFGHTVLQKYMGTLNECHRHLLSCPGFTQYFDLFVSNT